MFRNFQGGMALLVVGTMCGSALAADRTIPVTYRDFTGTGTTATLSNPPSTHPDFENEAAYVWNVVNQAPTFIGGLGIGVQPDTGIVETLLGLGGKPVYKPAGTSPTTTGAANFTSWYNDDAAYNVTIQDALLLADQGNGTYLIDTDRFFPIDGRGFGNTVREKDFLPSAQPPLLFSAAVAVSNEVHNWHFTMELHTQFTFLGTEMFTYRGDDDLWVFIDGRLVIDLGGVHNPLQRTISLASLNDVDGNPLNLVAGQNYSFDLFFAERHRNESNFRMETSILLGQEVPEPASAMLLAAAVGALALRRNRASA